MSKPLWLYIAAGFGAWALASLLVYAALRTDRADRAEDDDKEHPIKTTILKVEPGSTYLVSVPASFPSELIEQSLGMLRENAPDSKFIFFRNATFARQSLWTRIKMFFPAKGSPK